jgi:predicted DNA-binding mobile mystery protein A
MATAMYKLPQAALSRLRLDERLDPFRNPALSERTPKTGWIGAIRRALGMTRAQLGQRLGVTAASVADVERSEKLDRIQLDTLRRAAAALDCELVYALVPRQSLSEIVETRRNTLAEAAYRRTARSMALENQLEDDEAGRALKIRALRDAISSRDLWRD